MESEIALITASLRRRIAEIDAWFDQDDIPQIKGLKLRTFSCLATAEAPLQNADREESRGVQFRLSWQGSSGHTSFSDINVRFLPEGSMSKKDPRHRTHDPYFTVYVLDASGKEDHLGSVQFHDRNILDDAPLTEFLSNLLQQVCRHKKNHKIFDHKRTE